MRLIDRLIGWYQIRAEGDAAKALTDLLLFESVPAEIVREGPRTVVRIGRADAKRVLRQLNERNCTVERGELQGLPAYILRCFRRAGVLSGVLLAFLFFLFARGRVWSVEIEGDGSVDEDRIRAVVAAAGLRPGMALRDLSADEVASSCLLHEELFSSVNVSVSGVSARVEWIGRKRGPSTPASVIGEGVNLVASCDGVIVSVQPTCGTAAVVPGQTVHKGDLLISGVNKGGAVKADGVVLAKVTGEFTATAAQSVTVTQVTGRKPVSFGVKMFGEELFSFGHGADSVSETELTLPGGVVLPFSICVGYAHEKTETTVSRTERETAEAAFRRLGWMVREALAGGELLKKEVLGAFGAGGYSATAKTEYLINIAEPLAFTVQNEYNK